MHGVPLFFLRVLFAVFLLCGLSVTSVLAQTASKTVRVGILAYRGNLASQRTWAPTIEHLRRTLTDVNFSYLPLTLQQIAEQADQLDFIVTNPGHSFQLERIAGVSRIASARSRVNKNQMQDLGSVIFVRADSAIKTVGNLKDTRVGVVSTEAFGGYLAALNSVKQSTGADPNFRVQTLGFPQQNVVDAVLNGEVQVGIIRTCLLESLSESGKLDRTRVRVIGEKSDPNFVCSSTTQLYPGWAFLKVSGVSPDLATRITQALLSMPKNPSADKWLGHSSWIAPVSYASVETVYRELSLYPYNKNLRQTLKAWVERNYILLGVVIILCGAFMLHVGHIEFLVRRRSRQLETAGDQLTEALQRNLILENELAHAGRVSSLNILAGSLAHDLKQPLGAISTFSFSLLQRLERGTADKETLQKHLTRISQQANRASDFINSMRSFLNKQPEARSRVDLRDLIDESVMLMRTFASKHGCQLEWHRPVMPVPVCCDDVQLRQVAVVLLQNALDATVEAGLEEGTITIQMETTQTQCSVLVCDEGVGIPEELKERVFEPFYSSKGSLGLGLATAMSIVDSHEGTLTLNDRNPQGTCATVTLPLDISSTGGTQ
ncbi:PhnD/SsuA/transferrin family substrate-binding protein [Pseudovibrio sp. Tun.PSC04-5.I4]|uniref:sensor histidine kinase n=1 Tax=Pseudovibrio sp. Tun.PSC04-5.I4 TaxID=1798213 RepID=UPI000882A3C1|nr:PhnD/SsuA/transferrin family substrate-binding protein [Pseudovibrio sp. Tun.PSC04-5.I4]SDR06383.1 two-component system, LuxR family, sensor histidine kinase TtrS [Pseudovibrio sp. Tun.PSC04-5.I4]